LDCSYQETGMSERTIARKVIQHMDSAHDMKVIPADVMIKIKYSIRNKNAVHKGSPGLATQPLVVAMR
jgi:predicted small metal-binding protein